MLARETPTMTGLIKKLLRTIMNMKKYLIITAVFAAILASCSKDKEIETEDKIGGGITEFEADIPESKTYLGEKGADGWPNYWSNGDVIYVHNVTSKALKTGDGYVGTNYARFSMNGGVSPVGGKYYAAYPAARMSGWNSSTKKATVTIPATQTFTVGNYDPSAYVMVGTSTTQRLNFSPVMGLIKLTTTAPAEGTLYRLCWAFRRHGILVYRNQREYRFRL